MTSEHVWGGKNSIKYCTDCIHLGSHQSYPRSHPLHRTSRPGVYTECCCTGSHLKGSGVELRKQKDEEKITFLTVKLVINLLLFETVDFFEYRHCGSSVHRCRRCSQRRRHTASLVECSVHSCMETGRGRTSDHSHAKN